MKRTLWAKILAMPGTILVWLTILSPVIFGLIGLLARGRFNFDYLMPAEFGLVAFAGAALLLIAAILARSQVKLIAWGIGLALVMIIGVQLLAVVTGLADGTTEFGGWQGWLVMITLGLYVVCLVVIGVGGIRLLRHLFKKA